MSVYLAEFLGTFFLILIGGGVVAGVLLKDSKAFGSGWNTISVTWGLAVAFAFVGEFDWALVPGYIASQIAGAFFGGVIVWIFYIPHWSKTEDKVAKRSVFCTTPAIRSYLNNFISEMIGTAVLIFSLLFIGTTTFTEGLNPLVVGALIMLIGFALGGTTGYAINPARDLGPRLAHFALPIKGKGGSDWAYAFVPILGPILGSLLGASSYKILYESDFQFKYLAIIALVAVVLILAVLKSLKPEKSIGK